MAEREPPRSLLPPMTEEEVDRFLAMLRRSGHLATVRAGGGPQLGPVWFLWEGPVLWVVTFRKSARVRNIERRADVAMSVDGNRWPAIGLVLYGRATAHDVDAAVVERIVERYVPRAEVRSLVERYRSDPDRVLLRVGVDRIVSWDAAKRQEREG